MDLHIYYPEISDEHSAGTVSASEYDDLYSAVNTYRVQIELLDLCQAVACNTVHFEAADADGIYARTEGQQTVVLEIGKNIFASPYLYESLAHAVPQFTQYAMQPDHSNSDSDAENRENAPVP